jgi:hypothetical protein
MKFILAKFSAKLAVGLLVVLFGLAGAVALAKVLTSRPSAALAAPTGVARRPVLVELFTSEGCSSCPPADALLMRLDREQFVPGAEAIVLSEHVTYWNHDGWHDPYSLDDMTERQKEYGTRFGIDSVYTPQAVIDGAAQAVGSDETSVSRLIAQAAALPSLDLSIAGAERSGVSVRFKVGISGTSAKDLASRAKLVVALAYDSAESQVKRGENAGHTLRHVAVVRTLQEMGKGAFDGRELTLKLPKEDSPSPARLVAFLVDRHSGHVLGAAERTLTGQ